ncbi:hypothetical protein PJL18_03558 [Paenarthrobacter nicotinovorans]|nr:hypothetical protein [Paenarthrobacter nicotinovorans]
MPGVANIAVRELPADGYASGTVEATATLSGHIQPLVQELARLHLTDLVLEEPDLEEAVLTLYTGGEAPSSTGNPQRASHQPEGAHRA